MGSWWIFFIIILFIIIGNINKQKKEQAKRQTKNQNIERMNNYKLHGDIEKQVKKPIANNTILKNATGYNNKEITFSKSGGYVRDTLYVGKNADHLPTSASECVVACGYCGAKNIVPNNKSNSYSCFFCREKL